MLCFQQNGNVCHNFMTLHVLLTDLYILWQKKFLNRIRLFFQVLHNTHYNNLQNIPNDNAWFLADIIRTERVP